MTMWLEEVVTTLLWIAKLKLTSLIINAPQSEILGRVEI